MIRFTTIKIERSFTPLNWKTVWLGYLLLMTRRQSSSRRRWTIGRRTLAKIQEQLLSKVREQLVWELFQQSKSTTTAALVVLGVYFTATGLRPLRKYRSRRPNLSSLPESSLNWLCEMRREIEAHLLTQSIHHGVVS